MPLSLASTILLASLTSSTLASPMAQRQSTRPFYIANNCPTSVNLYIGGVLSGSIGKGKSVTKTLPVDSGFFYTNVNAGSPTAEGTSRAGFLGPDIYYIVKDPTYINAGISIVPHKQAAFNGFCPKIECDSIDCTQAFSFPPTGVPPNSTTPPTPPYFRCPVASVTFDITFCPTGKFPSQVTTIHPLFGGAQKCMDVRGAKFENGTPVQVYDCNKTNAQRWLITRGNTKVQLAGTNFCLDAGSNPASGVGLKIWQCYDNLAAQAWNYSDDDRITLVGKGQCLDLTGGNTANSNQLQTWQCYAGNNNQVWTV
ncbi:carbohydrate-binding module family 13 protein [Hypholoma sublateritium FD-334 SS-4]|uniref:Carbohydrate-binding module family 13 protein n=1 Tax=Hypholoma sublateritium (strain FD-334 SS-4) TaxID=945553 RepID=A0A0D2P490_HYPSF|nr:carbohydrate-binding module family 13 protein [Hypholoma sublateritium FD-334 SS-4]